jgi:pimeloyl-ACP methyl ester carboxylesterase
MDALTHQSIETNDIRLRVAIQGDGPLVLLCHGFPETSHSWQHQMQALAAAGYRAVAPDLRGYGESSRPDASDAYTQLHIVGDLVGLVDALGEKSCVLVGHDWGAVATWNAALMRPDRFRAVAGLSIPYMPRIDQQPTRALKQFAGERFSYILYFQAPGVAEAEIEADVPRLLRAVYHTHSAAGHAQRAAAPPAQLVPRDARWLDTLIDPAPLPAWLTPADLAVCSDAFTRSGFHGPLNWYRAIDRTWELMAPWRNAPVTVPALFMCGAEDRGLLLYRPAVEALPQTVPLLTKSVLLPGCGHWIQQERPDEVNAALLEFLAVVAPTQRARPA